MWRCLRSISRLLYKCENNSKSEFLHSIVLVVRSEEFSLYVEDQTGNSSWLLFMFFFDDFKLYYNMILFYSNKIKKATKTFLKNLWKLEKMAAFYVKIIGSFFLFIRPEVFGREGGELEIVPIKCLHHFWS